MRNILNKKIFDTDPGHILHIPGVDTDSVLIKPQEQLYITPLLCSFDFGVF
jgi:hypothetical protein